MITDSDEKIIDSVQLPAQQGEEIVEAMQSVNNFFTENPRRDSVQLLVMVEGRDQLSIPLVCGYCNITRSAAKIGLEEMLLLEVYSVRETSETARRGIVRFKISLNGVSRASAVYDVLSTAEEPEYIYDRDLRSDRYSRML